MRLSRLLSYLPLSRDEESERSLGDMATNALDDLGFKPDAAPEKTGLEDLGFKALMPAEAAAPRAQTAPLKTGFEDLGFKPLAPEQHLAPPSGPSMSPAPSPSLWERVKRVVLGNPQGEPGRTDTPYGRALGISYEAPTEQHDNTLSLLGRPTALAPTNPTTVAEGVAKGALQFVEDMGTPPNALMMAGSGGLGALGKVSSYLPRAVSAGFSLSMLRNAYQQFPEVKAAVDKGDWPGAAAAITKAGLTAGMGVLAGAHAVRGETITASGEAKAPIREMAPAERAVESAHASPSALEDLGFIPEKASVAEGSSALRDNLRALGFKPTQPDAGGEGAPVRRVTGSSNIPLNAQGRTQAQQLARTTAGQFDRIEHSPMDRAAETAQIVAAANPHAQVASAEGLGPWNLGAHEGQPVETETDAINDRIRNAPDEAPPGRGPHSTDQAEPFNDFRGRTVGHLMDQIATIKPGDTVLNITHGRDLRLIDSWLKNGAPEDRSIDVGNMTREGDWSGTGDLFRVREGGLAPADNASEPGIYYAHHGATDWNMDTPADTSPANAAPERTASVQPTYGRAASIDVPGEKTSYPARYAVRELADVQASHNPANFERNPNYAFVNDRDYSRPGNATRVIQNAAEGTFNPKFLTTDAPTAEHGTPVIDRNGNVLGGNSRTMTLSRVYGRGGDDAARYQEQLGAKAQQFGIDPAELTRFKRPVLVREITGSVDAQKAITDFNKAAAAELTPEERAVSDGRRLSPETIRAIGARLDDLGDEGTLAGALRGDDGAEVLNGLVKDGVLTTQEKGGYLDDRGNLTPEAKARIGKALVGRLYDSPAEFRETTPEMRGKLERIAPQILRVEGRPGWAITDTLRDAVALADEARAHKLSVDEQVKQSGIWSNRRYAPESVQVARALEQSPVKAAAPFRRYANDEALSRPGAQTGIFTPPTQPEAFADAFGAAPAGFIGEHPEAAGERGSVNLGDLAEALRREFPEEFGDEAKANYSGLGAIKDKFVRNLSQLEEASPAAHAAAVRAATSRSQAAALIRAVMPRISDALGSDGPTPEEFRKTLIESRLQGLRQRWTDLANSAAKIATAGGLDRFIGEDSGGVDRLVNLLGSVEGKRGDTTDRLFADAFPQDLRETAAALIEQRDFRTLGALLQRTFSDAAKSVARAMEPEEFEHVRQSPGFQRALPLYKELLKKPLAESHALNEGLFSNALGPLDTYYPLVPVRAEDAPRSWSGLARSPYRKPPNMANNFATGLAESYDASIAGLKDRVTDALRANNRAALITTLEREGFLRKLRPGENAPDSVEFDGQPYRAATVEVAPARQVIQDGRNVYTPAERAAMPAWLQKELEPVMGARDLRVKLGWGQRLADMVTALSLLGPTDFDAHANNLTGTLIANTPFLGKSLLDKAGSVPFVKKFAAIIKIAATDTTTPEAAKDLVAMAKLGVLPERYASETISRRVADDIGAERKLSFGPLLYGPKGIDVRARLVMYRIAKEVNPDASPLEIYKFVNQLGNYTRELQSEVERSAKASGLAPFFTAGSQMVRNGVNAFLGTGPMPSRGLPLRLAQQLTSGAAGTVAAWSLAYRGYTGKWPWDDNKAKFLKIPVNDSDRRSKLGRTLWGNGTETGYVDFGFWNPIIARGARALGVSGAFDAHMAGGNGRQTIEGAVPGPINAITHPFLGPPARALFVGVTGEEPYVTGVRDTEGRPGLQFLPGVSKTDSFPHVGAAVRDVGGVLGRLGEATGFLPPEGIPEKGDKYMRMLTDLAVPGLVARASNPAAKARVMQNERRAVESAERKERVAGGNR